MIIISLIGTLCAGKTTLLRPINNHKYIAIFDLYEYYLRKEAIKNGKFDWDFAGPKAIDELPYELHEFLNNNKDKFLCIIEHGSGVTVDNVLAEREEEVVEIGLKSPSNAELNRRAAAEGLPIKEVLKFAEYFHKKNHHKTLLDKSTAEQKIKSTYIKATG